MKKKALTGLLLLVMLIVLVACGEKDEDKPSGSGGKNGGSNDIRIVDDPNGLINIVDDPGRNDSGDEDYDEYDSEDDDYYEYDSDDDNYYDEDLEEESSFEDDYVEEEPEETSNISQYFNVYSDGLFYMDTDLLGVSYKKFKKKLNIDDLMKPESWPYWGNNLEVVYVNDDAGETYACFFQNDKLVIVYRDTDEYMFLDIYSEYAEIHGDASSQYMNWNDNMCYEWEYYDSSFKMYIETYDNVDYLRQMYTSDKYVE